MYTHKAARFSSFVGHNLKPHMKTINLIAVSGFRIRVAIVLVFSILALPGNAESRLLPVAMAGAPEDSLEVTSHTLVFVDTFGQFRFPEIEHVQFQPLKDLEYDGKFKRGKYVYWLKLTVSNRDSDAFPVFLNAGNFDSIQVWQQSIAGDTFYLSGSRVLASLEVNRLSERQRYNE